MNTTKVIIKGKEYIVNLDKAIEQGLISEVKKPVFYSIGQKFKNGETTFMLAGGYLTGVMLINLDDGNLWYDPVYVKNSNAITQEEFHIITIYWSHEFKLVS